MASAAFSVANHPSLQLGRCTLSNSNSLAEAKLKVAAINGFGRIDRNRKSSPHDNLCGSRITCFAVQESSSSTASLATEADTNETKAAAPTKPKSAAKKAPVKPLAELMEEEVIPPLKSILEAQGDLSDIELSFKDNRLEGSFRKQGNLYSFWAFFPDGALTGPKGFSLSSYGSGVSTVEPFLVDEKKITAKHVIFWVEKRLAAQGFIPVWVA